MKTNITVILPAKEIPLGSTVTKRTGTYKFKLADSITIYHEGGNKQLVTADDGNRFLLPNGDSRSISSISGQTELAWTTDTETLMQYLQELEYANSK